MFEIILETILGLVKANISCVRETRESIVKTAIAIEANNPNIVVWFSYFF